MFLYPYKIFTISEKKRIVKPSEHFRPVGIYDAELMNYIQAYNCLEDISSSKPDCKISILLGTIYSDVKLICLDLDDCFTPDGKMEADTAKFLEEFDSDEYEVSSSGEGIHIYVLTKLDLETFIVKEMEGCKSFECYTNKRHIVTTTFDFENTNLIIGKHDKFLLDLYKKVQDNKKSSLVEDVKMVFQGEQYMTEAELNGKIYKRTPVQDMYVLRGICNKDRQLAEIIDMAPDCVDQSAHDAKLIRKLMYYTLSFDSAWELAQKTNYYKAKDDKHKKKFNSSVYKERTRKFISRGGG